jgi:hypothetical protein
MIQAVAVGGRKRRARGEDEVRCWRAGARVLAVDGSLLWGIRQLGLRAVSTVLGPRRRPHHPSPHLGVRCIQAVGSDDLSLGAAPSYWLAV